MIPRSILFYWSKGAEVRRGLIRYIGECNSKGEPCFLNLLAKALNLSHVAVKKHLDLLTSEGYIQPINPKGKPVYLGLTETGRTMYEEFSKRIDD